MTNSLPLLGAALMSEHLAAHLDWLLADQRDLEIQDPYRPEVLDGDWRGVVQRVKTLLAGYQGRLGIHGAFDGLVLNSIDPKVSELASSRLCQSLEFAAELGATHMVVHSPWAKFGHAFVPHGPQYKRAELIARVQKTLEKPLKIAEQIRCTLVIENIRDTMPSLWMETIRAFGSAYVRASIDVGHAFLLHQDGGAPPDAYVREADSWLAHLHLQDTDGLHDRHWAPGDGNLNWYALFSALRSLQHQPRLVLELNDHTAIARGVKFLTERGLAR